MTTVKKKKKKCIYIDAVNEQRTVEKSLYSMRAQQSTSVPQPLEDWAGVSVDGTVQDGSASLDDGLRHVSFSLQHRRLCRETSIIARMRNAWRNAPEQPEFHVCTSDADEGQRSDGTHAVLGDAHICAGIAGGHVLDDQRAPAGLICSSSWNQSNIITLRPAHLSARATVSFATCLRTVVDGPGNDGRRRSLSVAG